MEKTYRHPSFHVNDMGEESRITVRVFDGLDAASAEAAEIFIRRAKEEVKRKGFFTVLLSGGKTPKRFYELLGSPPLAKKAPWDKIYLFWGDERCVNPTHPESNYRMVHEAMISKVGVPPENVHQMHGELKEGAALLYEEELESFFMSKYKRYVRVPIFDLVLLGMGNDGHILSLFPGSEAIGVRNRLVMDVTHEGIEIPHRLTMTLTAVNHAQTIVFLVSGREKAVVLRGTLEGKYEPTRYPAQGVRPRGGTLVYLVDKDAAEELK